MCTALSITASSHCFGRTLDVECEFGEEIVVMPRRFPFRFRHVKAPCVGFAVVGMATVIDGYPLFFDGVNESGLAMTALSFPCFAYYPPFIDGRDNIAPYELIPWILRQCGTLNDARLLLERLSPVNIPFSDSLPLSPLHWMISDSTGSLTLESTADGVRVSENPVGILTNSPPFEYQLFNLNNYRRLSSGSVPNSFSGSPELLEYCEGLGALGIPGDVSSMSRFVRLAFARGNSICNEGESEISRFFHLMSSVEIPKGFCRTASGGIEHTAYTCCMDTSQGIYYYTTYENRQISCIHMHSCGLDGSGLFRFALLRKEQIRREI